MKYIIRFIKSRKLTIVSALLPLFITGSCVLLAPSKKSITVISPPSLPPRISYSRDITVFMDDLFYANPELRSDIAILMRMQKIVPLNDGFISSENV